MTTNQPSFGETAPSQVRDAEPTFIRFLGAVGWSLIFVGTVVVIANRRTPDVVRLLPEHLGWMAIFFGLAMAFLHIVAETDDLLRRVVGLTGGAMILGGVGWGMAMALNGKFWSVGLLTAVPGVFFVSLYGRKESDATFRSVALYGVGALGLLLLAVGLIGAADNPIMLAGRWAPAMGLGIVATLLFLGCAGPNDDVARHAAKGLGAIGGLTLLLALARSIVPNALHDWREEAERQPIIALAAGLSLFIISLGAMIFLGKPVEETSPSAQNKAAKFWGRVGVIAGVLLALLGAVRHFAPGILTSAGWAAEPPRPFLFPTGAIFMIVGLISVTISLAFWSENRLVVMTRREFAAFFQSPVAYCVMFGFLMMALISFYIFVAQIQMRTDRQVPLEEPIVRGYVIAFFPVVAVMFAVPLLTMRLLSEEKRSGTLEVLLTVPVSDWLVVLSKFLGAWGFFQVLWLPWWLFLVALRLEGGQEFDFRPLLGFWLALAVSGAGFVAMGLFFSSLSRDQINAAVLSFMGMMCLIVPYFVEQFLTGSDSTMTAIMAVRRAVSFIEMWIDAVGGKLYVRDMVVHGSIAVFWLFMTAKVLEIRRWS